VVLGDQADDPAAAPQGRPGHALPRRPGRVGVPLRRGHADLEGALAPVGQDGDGAGDVGRVAVDGPAALVPAQLEPREPYGAGRDHRVPLGGPPEPDRADLLLPVPGRELPVPHQTYRSPGSSAAATDTFPPPARRGCRASLTRWVVTSPTLAARHLDHPEPDLGPAAAALLDRARGLQLDRPQLEPQLLALAGVEDFLELAAKLADHLGQFDHPSPRRAARPAPA
jgi:hypothetical protein